MAIYDIAQVDAWLIEPISTRELLRLLIVEDGPEELCRMHANALSVTPRCDHF